MSPEEKARLHARFLELEAIISKIHALEPVEGDPYELEKACYLEQDEIEFLLSEDYRLG
jgi:hypothetical protein